VALVLAVAVAVVMAMMVTVCLPRAFRVPLLPPIRLLSLTSAVVSVPVGCPVGCPVGTPTKPWLPYEPTPSHHNPSSSALRQKRS